MLLNNLYAGWLRISSCAQRLPYDENVAHRWRKGLFTQLR